MSVAEQERSAEAATERPRRLPLPAVDVVTVSVIAIAAVALVMRVFDLGSRAMHHDESLHAAFSWYLVDGRGYEHDPLMHGPFQFHLIAAFFALLGDSEVVTRLPHALAGTALVLTPLLLRRWLGATGTIATAGLLTVSSSLLYFSRFARNDIFVALWTVLLIVAIWRYRDDGRLRWLLVLAGALAVSFATKETAYLTAAVLLLYLAGALAVALLQQRWRSLAVAGVPRRRALDAAWLLPLLLLGGWLLAALWRPLAPLRRRAGWHTRPREADLLVVLGTLTAPLLAAAVQVPLERAGVEVAGDAERTIGLLTVGALVAGSAVVGLLWRPAWWALCAAVFLVITVPLYTTFFTHLDGAAGIAWTSLDYWMEQQGVERGGQPRFYYLMLLPTYELLLLVPALIGGAWLTWRRNGLAVLFAWWFVATLVALSLAGEKMPWLIVHLALPLAFLAGQAVGAALPRLWDVLSDRAAPIPMWGGAGVALAAGVMLLAYTVISGARVTYAHGDVPIEPLIYTQTTPEVPALSEQIIARIEQGEAGSIVVDTSQSLSWPWAWYLRHQPASYLDAEAVRTNDLAEDAILIAHADTLEADHPLRARSEPAIEYRHRWWFPEQGYRDASVESVAEGLADGSLIEDWWNFMLYRIDRANLSSVDGEVLFPER